MALIDVLQAKIAEERGSVILTPGAKVNPIAKEDIHVIPTRPLTPPASQTTIASVLEDASKVSAPVPVAAQVQSNAMSSRAEIKPAQLSQIVKA